MLQSKSIDGAFYHHHPSLGVSHNMLKVEQEMPSIWRQSSAYIWLRFNCLDFDAYLGMGAEWLKEGNYKLSDKAVLCMACTESIREHDLASEELKKQHLLEA